MPRSTNGTPPARRSELQDASGEISAGLVWLAGPVLQGVTVTSVSGDPGATPGGLFDVGMGVIVNGGSPVIDGCDLRDRTVSEFRLYLDDGSGNPTTLLSDVTIPGTGQVNYVSVYGADSIALSDSFATTTGSQFSAVFTSNPLAASDSIGPRVFELDGFAPVPEPGTLTMAALGILGLLWKVKRNRRWL